MKGLLQQQHRFLFYSCWIILGLIQSRYTELLDDEAYYWVYGQYLDWGYFDHPPMIGLLIKMGYSLFQNELGVRLYPLLLNVLSLMIIEKLCEKKNPFLFYGIALSIAVLQVIGFVAVPDIPLIFFTALFFLCYKNFVSRTTLLNTVLLGVAIALLFYSKYHAALIVFFTLLSHPRLFTRYPIYLTGVVALLLIAPHLWWQYQHNWVSFRYHLFESNVNAYKISFTLDYLAGQLLLPGPIAGFILLPAAFLYRSQSITERALKFTMIGIYAFFLLSSFRGRVEANWTSPVLVPLMVLSHQYLFEKTTWQRWLYRLLPVTLSLVLFARVIMIEDILPVKFVKLRYHAWKQWPAEMKKGTQGLPVVFNSSYQLSSKYWFYSGQMSYSLNQYKKRRNNYNFWPVEDSMLGRPVYLLDRYELAGFPDSLHTPIGWIGYRYDSSFLSFAKVKIETPQQVEIKEKETVLISGSVSMPGPYRVFIQSHALNDTLRIGLFNSKGWIKDIFTAIRLQDLAAKDSITVSFDPALPPGDYFFRFAINCDDLLPTHNSDKVKLTVK